MPSLLIRTTKYLFRIIVISLVGGLVIGTTIDLVENSPYKVCKTVPRLLQNGTEAYYGVKCGDTVYWNEHATRETAMLTCKIGNGVDKAPAMEASKSTEDSGTTGNTVEWEEAGVKGVRVKKMEEGGAAKEKNGSLVLVAQESEL